MPKYSYLVVKLIVGPIITSAKWNRVAGGDCNEASVHKVSKNLELLDLTAGSDNFAIDKNKITEKRNNILLLTLVKGLLSQQ